MKKLSILLVVSMILSSFTPVLAESELEQVVVDVKSRIEIDDYENFDSSYYEREGQPKVYTLSWSSDNDDEYEYVDIKYSGGFIQRYSYSKSYDSNGKNKFPKITIEEAMKTAEEFTAKINPLYKDKIKLTNDRIAMIGNRTYYFILQRFEQGFPVLDETGVVSVNNVTGEVTHYSMNFDTDAVFPTIGEPITKDDALSSYKNNLAPKLQYSHYYNYRTKEHDVFLEYVSSEKGKRIDALTGEVIDMPSNYGLYEYKEYSQESMADAGVNSGGGLSPAELEEISKIEALVSQEEAEKIARECEYIDITTEFELTKSELDTYYTDTEKYFYSMSFSNDDEYKSISINAQDGSIVEFYRSGVYKKDYKHNSEEELKKAEAAFADLAGDKKNEYRLVNNKDGDIRFSRFVNDVEVSFDSTWFGFDDNGELTRFDLTYTENAEFPKPDGILTSNEICDIMANEYDFAPVFAIDGKKNEAVLFYTLLQDNNEITFRVEPFNAKSIDYNGEVTEESEQKKYEYSDIAGHWAEEQIKKLAEYGIGFDGGVLSGNNNITQKELVKLLGVAFANTTEYEYALNRLISNKVIEKDSYIENDPITRESAAIIFIRMLGGEEYAKFEDIYVQPFNDVTRNKGYIALLKALKVVSGDSEGNFCPDRLLTRAEALIMIYNYLNR